MNASASATVLICEDSDVVRELMREVVTGAGMRPLETADGFEALQLAGTERPDAIILDVLVYGCSGLEVLERLKSDPLLAPIPVILVTGSGSVLADRYLTAYGADRVLAKPFGLHELTDALDQMTHGADTTSAGSARRTAG
jgi:CheY-like chemotaxis protein